MKALNTLLICSRDGSRLSCCAPAARHHAPEFPLTGVGPDAEYDATRSFRSGELKAVKNLNTITDGAQTPDLGEGTFPLVLAHADDMVTVSDAALVRAMHLLWERMKIVVEPTGALGTAAPLDGGVPGEDRRIAVVLSGGNVDLGRATALFKD